MCPPSAVRDPPPASTTTAPSWKRSAAHGIALVLIVLLGGALRFYDQDTPPLWGDESATFSRVCGSYQQMLDAIRTAGFGPLHYELYWWIGQGMPLPGGRKIVPGGVPFTPGVMRFVPALAGTLMIPAMYFLARQLASRRTALLVALLTAVSAYLLIYARDAKMYAATWLFITLHVASLLWFLRSRSWTAWLSFVAAGSAMVGMHLVSLVILPLDLLIALTARRGHWWALPRIALAIPWVAWLPIGGLLDRIDSLAVRGSRWPLVGRWLSATWMATPRRWIAKARLDSIGSRGLPGRLMRHVGGGSLRLPGHLPPILPVLLGIGIVVLGPIGYTRYFNTFDDRVLPGERNDRTAVNIYEAGIGWVPNYNRNRDGGDLVLFTVSAWLTGWEWPRKHDQPPIDPLVLNLLSSATITMIAVLLLGLLPWQAGWAYLRSRRSLRRADPAMAHPAGAGVLRWRPLFWIAAWLILPTYAWYAMSIRDATAPTDLVLQAVLRDSAPVDWPRFPGSLNDPRFNARTPAPDDYLAFVRALPESLRQTLQGVGQTPKRWPVIIGIGGLLLIGLWLAGVTWKQRLQAATLATLMLAALLLLAQVIRLSVYQTSGSVWMPRYLAVTLPAFLVASAVLLRRLPTRTLRLAAIALFVVVNLVQYRNRLYMGSEPPTDLMAADLVRAEKDAEVAVVHAVRIRQGVEPGTATFFGMVIRQYLAVMSGMDVTPSDIRSFGPANRVDRRFIPPPVRSRDEIVRRARRDPGVRTLIVWDQLEPGQVDHHDRLGDALGTDWKRVEHAIFVARDHWTWGDWAQVRRRVYVRQPPAPPATTGPVGTT